MFSFRKILQKGIDHPLGDPREVKRLLEELPADDPPKGLHELSSWLEAVRNAQGGGLDERVRLFKLLDEAAQPLYQAAARQYLETPNMEPTQRNRLWLRLLDMRRQGAEAYLQCIEAMTAGQGSAETRDELPLLTVRAVRALADQDKWLCTRYRPKDARLWERLSGLYRLSESRLFTLGGVVPYDGTQGRSNVLLEFARALLLNVSATDKLAPRQIELADRLSAYCAGEVVLNERPEADSMFYLDFSAKAPPARLLKGMPIHSAMRFFAAAPAALKLEALAERLKAEEMPEELDFAGFAPQEVTEVIAHLGQYWAPSPSQRRHPRRRIVTRLEVIHGARQIQRTIVAEKQGLTVEDEDEILYREAVDMKIYGFITAKTRMLRAAAAAEGALAEGNGKVERWVMENVSECGYGAVIPELDGDWVRIGTLLALKPEGGDQWSVGVVRRIGRDREHRVYVGIETLAKDPAAVRLWPLAREISIPESSGEAQLQDHVCGLLLHPIAGCGEIDSLLVGSGNFAPDKALEMLVHGDRRLIKLEQLLEAGKDFERVSFAEIQPLRQV